MQVSLIENNCIINFKVKMNEYYEQGKYVTYRLAPNCLASKKLSIMNRSCHTSSPEYSLEVERQLVRDSERQERQLVFS